MCLQLQHCGGAETEGLRCLLAASLILNLRVKVLRRPQWGWYKQYPEGTEGNRIGVIQVNPEEENISLTPQRTFLTGKVYFINLSLHPRQENVPAYLSLDQGPSKASNPMWSGKAAPEALGQLHGIEDIEAEGVAHRTEWVRQDVGDCNSAHGTPKYLFSLVDQQISANMYTDDIQMRKCIIKMSSFPQRRFCWQRWGPQFKTPEPMHKAW